MVSLVAWLASCRPRSEGPGGRVDRALGGALRSLIAGQSPDGAWRSSTYGVFKDGLSLTPTVLKAVAFGPDVDGSATARRRGAEYLVARVRADGSIDGGPFGMIYPVYTASAAVITLTVLDVPAGRGCARRLAPRAAPAAIDRGPRMAARRSGVRRLGLLDRAAVQGDAVLDPSRIRSTPTSPRRSSRSEPCGSPGWRPTTPRSARP